MFVVFAYQCEFHMPFYISGVTVDISGTRHKTLSKLLYISVNTEKRPILSFNHLQSTAQSRPSLSSPSMSSPSLSSPAMSTPAKSSVNVRSYNFSQPPTSNRPTWFSRPRIGSAVFAGIAIMTSRETDRQTTLLRQQTTIDRMFDFEYAMQAMRPIVLVQRQTAVEPLY